MTHRFFLPGGVLFDVGAVLRLKEDDYRYGVGPLEIEVNAIGAVYPDEKTRQLWVVVRATEHVGDLNYSRIVSVKVDAIGPALIAATPPEDPHTDDTTG